MPDEAETRDVERGIPSDDSPQRQRGTIPSFLFISFVLFMLTNNQNGENVTRSQYLDVLGMLNYELSNYTAWINGTESNFTLPEMDRTVLPLAEDFMNFGSRVDPQSASYYTNLTGSWRGDVLYHSLFDVLTDDADPLPWYQHALDYTAAANLTNGTELNATELEARLGTWKWERSESIAMSFGDRIIWNSTNASKISGDISYIHGKIDLWDPDTSDEFRLEIDGVHFVSNGTIYAFAQPSGSRGTDIRNIPSLVPSERINETARVVETELSSRLSKLKESIDSGAIEENQDDEGPKSKCSFQLYAQIQHNGVPQSLLQELEDEIDDPSGIFTIRPPEMKMKGVLMSADCGILYELPDIRGLKAHGLLRKITTYAGLSTIVYFALLSLHFRQTALSRSATGLSRVSRYPILIQSLIDAISFIGHITLAILADGRTSVSVLAPAVLSCILFIYEAQFAILIGQIQAPEDVPPPPPRRLANPSPPTAPGATSDAATATQNTLAQNILPTTTVTPPIQPQQPTLFRSLYDHFRSDPSARLWAFMSFFLLVVFRIIIALSLPIVFIGALYSSIWIVQIYRAVRRGRTSGLTAEYLFGTTFCRLFFVLYFFGCPKNILDIDPRRWVYAVAFFILLQVVVILLQEHFGPTFFLPKGVGTVQTYDYHPAMPLPDAESPEQSLGDCAICMDAILVDPALRQRPDEKNDGHGLVRRTGGLFVQSARKSYSLAPCHHLF
ncbi:hypothetical protein PHLCEN_2v10138, partial [Hermanssonia centrifuga]